MARIWSDEGKLATWLEVELAATAAWADLGVVPGDVAARIAEAAPPSPERVAELEATLHHDTAAFVDAVAEQLGEEGRWFHYGLTSSDVVDTALSLQIQAGGRLLAAGLERALAAVAARATTAAKARSSPARIRAPASRTWSESAVSTTSDDVRP